MLGVYHSRADGERFLKAGAVEIAKTARKLARCQRGSNGRRKAKRALAADVLEGTDVPLSEAELMDLIRR